MKIPNLLLIACLVICFNTSCKKTSTPAPSSAPTPTAAASPEELHHPEGGAAVTAQTKYFKGSIGTTLDLQMKLVRTGDQLSGSYFYQKVGTKIDLRGSVDSAGNVSLDEFDSTKKQTGTFKGIWKTDSDGLIAISGNWSKPATDKGSEKKTAFSLHEEPISLTGDVELTAKQIKENNKKSKYDVDVQYPQFSGGSNPNFEKFNQAARALVTGKVAEFKKEMSADAGDAPASEGDETSNSDISIAYTVILVQDDLASIDFDISSYYHGAAHPNSYSSVLNFDLKNGKQLKLSDLFKPGAKYLQTISAYCMSDLKKQSKQKDNMLDDSMIQEGASASAKNYESWVIKKTGLGINFDPYQVGPYAAGPQFVLIPWSTVKDMINPDGPAGQFVK